MKNKKTMKIISASAIAASAFVSTTATNANAATVSQADKLVQAAKSAGTVLKWTISIEGTADGKTRPWEAYNNAKTAYDQAVKAVNTLPAAQKNKYLAELDQDVKLHIDRTMRYIDAITAGEKIKEKQQTLAYQLDINTINDQTETAFHELSTEIRKQAILLDRVYGQSTRDLIRSQYKQAAEKVRDNAKYAVTVKIEIDLATKALAANNSTQAEKHIAEAKKYMNYVDNTVIKNVLNNRLSSLETTTTLKVQKVSAAEPRRIKVEFNKAMLAGSGTNSAENTKNYTVSSRSIRSVTLSDDKKSAIIELYDSLYTNTTYSVTVKKNIQTANYETLGQSDSTSSFTFTKSTKPTVSFVTTDSKGNLEIKFSEMIDSNSPVSVTLNGKEASINTLYNDTDTAVIPKAELDRIGLQKGKNYSIVVTGAKDLLVNSPNTMNKYSGTFYYNSLADTSLPVVRSVQTKGERTFTIEFNETLIDLTASHLVITKGNTAIRPTSVKDISGNKTKFEIELPASVYGTNESSVRLNVQVKDYKDLANNVGRSTDYTINITKDVAPLKFIRASYDNKANEFHIFFDKTLKTGTPLVADITAYGPDGKTFTPKPKANSDTKMIIDAKNLPDGDYTFNINEGTVKDNSSSQNGNEWFTTSITKREDMEKPKATILASSVNGQFKVSFSEPVTEETATLYSNYQLNKISLPSDTQFDFSIDKKLVIITLPEGHIEKSGIQTITVTGVKDPSGNIMASTSLGITIKENKQPELVSAVLVGSNIRLTFSENIQLLDSGKTSFDITSDNDPVSASDYKVESNSSNKREIIISPLSNSELFTSGSILINTKTNATIKDDAGNTIKAGISKTIN
ncbi:Ig-like domain-containing protein [Bacillus sp. S/N-304-OC-R1]|uniref:Ig-like domain-containing protein n=1 Tax=Bacillus sp. S/N-304-OC-R1 TaxID=2758034 RepID=UPI001C8E7955|nr:Ig-like domain-containing protein [Bacillus sp. S/N-304-OC-R1]MBY0122299.1 Ig-like domain-containing protein [Bacillus sp. S/N-304-OC-R1]